MNPTVPRPLARLLAVTATVLALVGALVGLSARAADAAPADAPGAPGAAATWTTGDKEGLGTSQSSASKVWYTLTGGTMSEVYYPSGVTPNVRELQFAVTDGASWTQLETDATVTRSVTLADRSSLTYQQTSADQQGRWRLTKTYITDPARPTVLVDVSFERLKPGAMQLFALYDPSLAGDSGNDSGTSSGPSLTASDTHDAKTPIGSALVSSAPFVATSTGYVGTSDGATTLRTNHTLTPTYASAGPGNIAQAGQV
ncbi:MAG TPA: hypothetical protein VEQ83_02755, partial [Lapillicoccus sp.]|nr:hypothetical protein [Lapillicoccus sp.]